LDCLKPSRKFVSVETRLHDLRQLHAQRSSVGDDHHIVVRNDGSGFGFERRLDAR
jgi:hypothetical protein